MSGDEATQVPTLGQLGVSLSRRDALKKAIRTGRIQDLPWAAFRPPLDIPCETVIDQRYRIGQRIGAGGFGGVFDAEDLLTGRRVAVKVISELSFRVRRRMLQEIAVLRRLDLPCVVGFIDEGDFDDHPYVVMPYLSGDRFPGTDHDGSWWTLGPRVLALAEALARVHGAGVLHRDLKPDNVLWVHGAPMLLDFGLSVSEALVFEEDEDLAGSPAYLAPEQYLGDEPTERSDLWSLGVLIYEAVCGELPFSGTATMDVITQLLTTEPAPLVDRAPVPDEVGALVAEMLRKNPEQRIGTAAALVRRLRAVVPLPPGLPEGLGGAAPADLERAFAGPEVVHHLCSDPARVLWRRTGGDPDAVAQTLGAWVRAGVARPTDDGRLQMERGPVDGLLAGMPVDPCREAGEGSTELGEGLEDLWLLVELMAPWTEPERLAGVMQVDAMRVDAGLQELSRRGLVACAPDPIDARAGGWFATRSPPRPDGALRFRLHAQVADAVPAESNERLRHLVAAGRMDDLPDASVVVGDARRREGRHQEAWVAARAGLVAERRMGSDKTDALVLAATLALEGFMRTELQVVELEARRRRELGIAELCLCATATMRGVADRSMFVGLDLSAHPSLAHWPDTLWAHALQRHGLEEHEAWIAERKGSVSELRWAAWVSRLRMRQGQLADAAELAERARVGLAGTRFVAATLNASGLWMDAGRFERASTLLDEVDGKLSRMRTGTLEAFAQYLRRGMLYRRGVDVSYSADFVEALALLDAPAWSSSFVFLEAAFAWRRREHALALKACDTVRAWSVERPLVGLMENSLMALLGELDLRKADLLDRARRPGVPPGIRAQVVACHAAAGGVVPEPMALEVRRELDALGYPRHLRRELLSAQEVHAYLGGSHGKGRDRAV